MAEISIIVPVYNVEKYLENCIDSILNQTFKDYELILVDDGSTDKSGDICDKYEKKDIRIKVIHKSNEGLSSARNIGLDMACGKYIGFIDSDDSIHPRMYEILYDLIQTYKADISCCDYKKTDTLINDNYEDVDSYEVIEMDNIESVNSLYNMDTAIVLVVAWNKLYSKELFKDIRYEIGKIHEDEFIAHKLLYNSRKTIYTNSKLYYYLQREGSITSKESNNKKLDKITALSQRMKFLNEKNLVNAFNNSAWVYETYFFSFYNEFLSLKISSDEYEIIKILQDDFISNLSLILKSNKIGKKSKLLYLIFYINPKAYNIVHNIMNNKMDKNI